MMDDTQERRGPGYLNYCHRSGALRTCSLSSLHNTRSRSPRGSTGSIRAFKGLRHLVLEEISGPERMALLSQNLLLHARIACAIFYSAEKSHLLVRSECPRTILSSTSGSIQPRDVYRCPNSASGISIFQAPRCRFHLKPKQTAYLRVEWNCPSA